MVNVCWHSYRSLRKRLHFWRCLSENQVETCHVQRTQHISPATRDLRYDTWGMIPEISGMTPETVCCGGSSAHDALTRDWISRRVGWHQRRPPPASREIDKSCRAPWREHYGTCYQRRVPIQTGGGTRRARRDPSAVNDRAAGADRRAVEKWPSDARQLFI